MFRRRQISQSLALVPGMALLVFMSYAGPDAVRAACAADGEGCFELDAQRAPIGTEVGVTMTGLDCGTNPLVMVIAKEIAHGGREYVAMPPLWARTGDRYSFTVPKVPLRRYLLSPACNEVSELGFLPVELPFTVIGPPDTATIAPEPGPVGDPGAEWGWPMALIVFFTIVFSAAGVPRRRATLL